MKLCYLNSTVCIASPFIAWILLSFIAVDSIFSSNEPWLKQIVKNKLRPEVAHCTYLSWLQNP